MSNEDSLNWGAKQNLCFVKVYDQKMVFRKICLLDTSQRIFVTANSSETLRVNKSILVV